MPKKYIYIEVLGENPNYRYLVSNTQNKYYTGKQWTTNRGLALLYENIHEASRDALNLIKEQFTDCKLVLKYTVPIAIEFYTNKPPEDIEEFRKWLHVAITTSVNYPVHGYGPTPESLVVAQTNWLELKGDL